MLVLICIDEAQMPIDVASRVRPPVIWPQFCQAELGTDDCARCRVKRDERELRYPERQEMQVI